VHPQLVAQVVHEELAADVVGGMERAGVVQRQCILVVENYRSESHLVAESMIVEDASGVGRTQDQEYGRVADSDACRYRDDRTDLRQAAVHMERLAYLQGQHQPDHHSEWHMPMPQDRQIVL
jgi:hypothetical protein